MVEQYWPRWEPNWPITFTVAVKTKQQADTLACSLIPVERYLRHRLPKSDFKQWGLADRLAVARRNLQGGAGLLANPRWFALVHQGRILQEICAIDAEAALAQFKAIFGELPIGSTFEMSTGKNESE